MSRSRAPLALGLAAAGGVGYYLFASGGDAQAAKLKIEKDAHKAAASVKANLPVGNDPNTEKSLKNYGAEAGAKIDSAISEADKQAGRAKSNVEAYAKDTKAEALKAVNTFDSKVETEASKAKTGISNWFGSSK